MNRRMLLAKNEINTTDCDTLSKNWHKNPDNLSNYKNAPSGINRKELNDIELLSNNYDN